MADLTARIFNKFSAFRQRTRIAARTVTDSGKRVGSVSLAFLRRVDVLSAARPVRARDEAILLIFAPILTFCLVYAATSAAGVAYRSGCNSASNFVDNLLLRAGHPSTCVSVPFLSDIPTMILSFTCPFALVAYRLLRRRISWIIPQVAQTGLVHQQQLRDELSKEVNRLESAVDLTLSSRVTLFIFTAALTTWLYTRNLFYGHLFILLARSRNGASS